MHLRLVILAIGALSAALLGGTPVLAETVRITVTDQKNVLLEDAVVVAIPLSSKPRSRAQPRPQVIDQINKEFVPLVKGIQTNTPVVFPNKDNIRHHLYSFSSPKKFELPLYAGIPANPVIFDKPGIVVLGCNIHDWMLAYVYVTDSPYYGATGKEGTVDIEGLAVEEYEVQAWHPGLVSPDGIAKTRLRVNAMQTATASLQLVVKPITRGRRAPRAGGGGYR